MYFFSTNSKNTNTHITNKKCISFENRAAINDLILTSSDKGGVIVNWGIETSYSTEYVNTIMNSLLKNTFLKY